MLTNARIWGAMVLAAGLAAGCSESEDKAGPAKGEAKAAADSPYLVAEAPKDAQGVAAAREAAKGDEEVTVVGHIGGSEQPFVEGVAAFTIVDPQLHWCHEDEGCPTPWDYCCSTDKLKTNTALVKVVGKDGKPVMRDAKELLGVKELSKVTVRGKAKRDDEGNLTVLAEQVHVAKE